MLYRVLLCIQAALAGMVASESADASKIRDPHPEVLEQRSRLSARLDALAAKARDEIERERSPEERVGQWGNWPNYWSNFNNWRNW